LIGLGGFDTILPGSYCRVNSIRVYLPAEKAGWRRRASRAAWNGHGTGAFVFEVLERLEEEEFDFARESTLKERTALWRARLKGAAI
jgi:hypothetical protein